MFEFNLSTDPRGRIFLDPVAFADMSPDRALKVLVARLPNLG